MGFCGRLSFLKNPERFVNIVGVLKSDFPNISAVMIGDGELKEEVKSLIKEKGLNDNIQLLGFQKEPYPIMQSCEILCVPSRWEGYGLVAVEALVLGVPVVCSNVGGLSGIVNDECGKVCQTEDEMIGECLQLLTRRDYLEHKSEVALIRANELNNVDSYKMTLKVFYENSLFSL